MYEKLYNITYIHYHDQIYENGMGCTCKFTLRQKCHTGIKLFTTSESVEVIDAINVRYLSDSRISRVVEIEIDREGEGTSKH